MGGTEQASWVKDYLSPGVGVFLGVVAGAVVQFALFWIVEKLKYSRQKKNLKFEMEYNKIVVQKMSEEVRRIQSAISSHSLHQYPTYLKFTDVLFVTVNNMLQNGMLYKAFTRKEVGTLVKLSQDFSAAREQFVHQKLTEMKETNDYSEGNQFIGWLDRSLNEAIEAFEELFQQL